MSYLQRKGLVPLRAGALVDRLGLKLAVTKLNHTERVGFSCKCWPMSLFNVKEGHNGEEFNQSGELLLKITIEV